jgi:hypothetical protein
VPRLARRKVQEERAPKQVQEGWMTAVCPRCQKTVHVNHGKYGEIQFITGCTHVVGFYLPTLQPEFEKHEDH